MGRIIEKLWDCKYCNNKGIGGGKRECPFCGATRDTDTKFYMPDEITYVPEEKAKEVSRKPDWVCNFCQSLNPDKTDVCISCGASRTGENLNYFENRKKPKERKATNEEIAETSQHEYSFEDESYDKDESTSRAWGDKCKDGISSFFGEVLGFIRRFWPGILIVSAIIALIIGGIWLFTPKTEIVTIEQISWERSIEVERYQTVNESDWYLPAGARLHETKSEIYTYEEVIDHYEDKTRQVEKQRLDHYDTRIVGYKDLGNGYAEEITEPVPVYETYYETEHYKEPVYRSEPVYKTKYYYEIDKWLHDRNLDTSGFDKSPYWADTSNLGSDERTSTKKEEYFIWYTNEKGKSKKISMPYKEWGDLMVGDVVTIKVSIFGNRELA